MKVKLTEEDYRLVVISETIGVDCEVPEGLVKRYWRTEKNLLKVRAELAAIFNATLDKQDEEGS
jgi:hypothetical protein